MTAHHCHALECGTPCLPRMLFCGPHWKLTPKPIQSLIWATYREGQEITKTPTRLYLVAQAYAVAAVALRENRVTTVEATQHIAERLVVASSGKLEVADAIGVELKRLDPNGRAFFLATHVEAPSDLWALTYWRPWPSLILRTDAGRKDCENRTQPPPKHLLGKRVAIHAGKTYGVGSWPIPGGAPPKDACPMGIVGTALLLGVLDLRDPRTPKIHTKWGTEHRDQKLTIPEGEELHRRISRLSRSPWWCGPVGLLLTEPRTLAKPIACKGAMGWWRVDAEDARQVAAQEAGAS